MRRDRGKLPNTAAVPSQPPPGRLAPALALALLAPVIAEVLSGATRISYLFALVPEIMVWGCGALIIRETIVRWRAGWTSTLMLGLALSVAEEFIIQQTSIAPLPWAGSVPSYDRVWGVNWTYFLYMLGYESVWIVLVPTQLTYLIFPDRRESSWLRRGGLFIAALIFLPGSFIAWFAWTQQARPLVFHVPRYEPPVAAIAAGLAMILLLVTAAYLLRRFPDGKEAPSRRAPSPWMVAIGGLLLAMPWWVLISLVFIPNPPIAPAIPLAAGVLWAVLAFAVIRRWSSGRGWGDHHRWAIVFSAILACMAGGFAGSSTWLRLDLVGKAFLNVIAVVCLLALARKIRRSSPR